jgi:hypothetical protein
LIAATGTIPDEVTTAACSRPSRLMVHKRMMPPSFSCRIIRSVAGRIAHA